MKKFTAYLVLTAILMSLFCVTASAEQTNMEVVVPFVSKQPVFDGAITSDEWGSATVHMVTDGAATADSNKIGYNEEYGLRNTLYYFAVEGISDTLSYDLWLRWDRDYLYVAAVVNDPDPFSLPKGGEEIWNGDMLQLRVDEYGPSAIMSGIDPDFDYRTDAFDGKRFRKPWASDLNTFNAILGLHKGETPTFWRCGRTYGDGWDLTRDGAKVGISYSANPDGSGVITYEGAIPWRAVSSAISPEVGTVYGMAVAVGCSAPGKNYYNAWLQWGSGVIPVDENIQPRGTRGGSQAIILGDENGGYSEIIFPYYYGDVNSDTNINLTDASVTLQHIAGWGSPLREEAADVNADGKVNLADVSRLLKYVAKWDVALGPVNNGSDNVGDGSFEEADFGGAEFKFLHYGSTATDYYDEYIRSESYTGAAISDAVTERNRVVEDEYNVVITAEECDPTSEVYIRQLAGQCDFDVVYDGGTRLAGAALDGMLYDLLELAEWENIDLTRSHWYPGAVDGLTVAGKLFVAPNAVSMNGLSQAEMIYFNKNICDELNLTYPYDAVYNGGWTYDVLYEMSVGAEKDVNRDGAMDNRDRFGGIDGETLLSGVCAAPLTAANGDGTYTFIPYTEGMVAQYSKYYSKFRAVESLTAEQIVEGKDISAFPSLDAAARFLSFGEGNALFMKGTLEMSKEFAKMKDNYGIVPVPAIAAGEGYSCEIDYRAPMFSMPAQLHDPEMAAIVFDYMAYESERLLLPAYIETTLKTKRVEDSRDYDMLDVIRDSVDYRWEGLYLWDSTATQIRDMMIETGNFASVNKQYGAECQSEIDGVAEKLLALEG